MFHRVPPHSASCSAYSRCPIKSATTLPSGDGITTLQASSRSSSHTRKEEISEFSVIFHEHSVTSVTVCVTC